MRGADQRERILRAARALFAEIGFSAATTRAIARQAGVPLGSVHYHFESKEALYTWVVRELLVTLVEAIGR